MGAVSTSQLTALLKSTDASALRDVPVAEAPERRNHALASLRGEKDGSQVADVLTSTFPQDTGGVPLYVGLGTYANQKAIVVIEAYGARGGVLDHKRLWVLTTTGSPLYSSSSK